MAKKEYKTPELEVNAFAQFENVYTACDKNPSRDYCVRDDDWKEGDGSGYSHHNNLPGGGGLSDS